MEEKMFSTVQTRRGFLAGFAVLATTALAACGQQQAAQSSSAAETPATSETVPFEDVPNVPDEPLPAYLEVDSVDFQAVTRTANSSDAASFKAIADGIADGSLDGQVVALIGKAGVKVGESPASLVCKDDESLVIPYECVSLGDTGIYPEAGAILSLQGVVRKKTEAFELVVPAWGLGMYDSEDQVPPLPEVKAK